MKPSLLLVFVLVAALLSGCVSGNRGDGADDDSDEGPTTSIIGDHALPAPDAARVHDLIANFAAAHPGRVTGTPAEDAATTFLMGELEAIGYNVTLFTAPPLGLPLPLSNLRTIVATIDGTTMPDHWLAWGGHYDTAGTTVYGTYDNGSGTGLALEVARMLANETTNRTKAVLLFNGEEEGVLASSAFVDNYAAQSDYTIDLFVGFDMVGIPAPIGFFSGAAYATDFVPLAEAVAYGLLNLSSDPADTSIAGSNTRNSDEAVFAQAGIPTMRFAGLATAGAYWGYHKVNDTIETIHEQAGGRAVFERGLADTASWAYSLILAVDVAGPPEREAAT